MGWFRFVVSCCLLSLIGFSSGCSMFNRMMTDAMGRKINEARANPPVVTAGSPQLVRAPTLAALAAYYCPQVVTDRLLRLGCTVAVGAPPSQQQLEFEFAVPVTIKNPNNVPVPALDVLLALKLFPGQNAEALGSVCISMCGANEPSCTGQAKPGACTAGNGGIKTAADFVRAIPGLIVGLANGTLLNEIKKSLIPAGGDVHLNLAFPLGIDQALRVIQNVIQPVVESLVRKQRSSLEIPVAAEGTVFVNLPVIGRLGVPFGPIQSVWRVM
ncbi:MAG TPA: hypothetical protein PKE31_03520 [Pseudomonadota bacterium]|jgi:hypothetical protein|nr:hypothetical protein [Pseudomonadota bacterium]